MRVAVFYAGSKRQIGVLDCQKQMIAPFGVAEQQTASGVTSRIDCQQSCHRFRFTM